MVVESGHGHATWHTKNDIEYRIYTVRELYGVYEAVFPGVKGMNQFVFEDIVYLYHSATMRTIDLVNELNMLDYIIKVRSFKSLDRTLHQIVFKTSSVVAANNTNAIIVRPDDDEGPQKTRIAKEVQFGLIWIDKKIFTDSCEATAYIWERLLEYYKEDTEVVAMLLNYRNKFSYYFYSGKGEMEV